MNRSNLLPSLIQRIHTRSSRSFLFPLVLVNLLGPSSIGSTPAFSSRSSISSSDDRRYPLWPYLDDDEDDDVGVSGLLSRFDNLPAESDTVADTSTPAQANTLAEDKTPAKDHFLVPGADADDVRPPALIIERALLDLVGPTKRWSFCGFTDLDSLFHQAVDGADTLTTAHPKDG